MLSFKPTPHERPQNLTILRRERERERTRDRRETARARLADAAAPRSLFALRAPRARALFSFSPSRRRPARPGNRQGRYLHAQLTPSSWRALADAGEIRPAGHPLLDHDGAPRAPRAHRPPLSLSGTTLSPSSSCPLSALLPLPSLRHPETGALACLNADAPGGSLLEEFHLKTHWKVLLAGQRGAGMFNHSDSLGTSSWHAHLAGAKWWHVCAPDGAACAEAVVSAGEVVFYGPGYTARRGLRRGRG